MQDMHARQVSAHTAQTKYPAVDACNDAKSSAMQKKNGILITNIHA